MGKTFMFTEGVLDRGDKDTKEVLAYLKDKKCELMAISSQICTVQEERLKQQGIADYFDYLFSDVEVDSMDMLFFCSRRNEIVRRLCQQNSLLRHSKDALRVDCSSRIVITDSLDIYRTAENGWWKSIYYADGTKNIAGGHKIKQLSTLKSIY